LLKVVLVAPSLIKIGLLPAGTFVRPKNTSLTGADCVAISVGYQNGMITNGLTNVPAGSSPILINDGATNTTFSN
ncbi:hypothetical protein ACUODF_57495, partial [Escherichia coli]